MSRLEALIRQLCPDGVEYKRIGAIAEVGTGSSNGNEASDDGQYPFFIRSQTIKLKNDYEYDEEPIIIPGEGGIGEIFHYINGKYALHQRVYRIHFLVNDVVTKFAYYYMQAYFKPFILKKAVSATVTSIRKPMIEEFSIPFPPMEVQQEIVRILDNFTELTAELTARKKQYEYYRDNLMTFNGPNIWVELGTVIKSLNTGLNPRRFFKLNADDATNYYVTIREIQNNTIVFSAKTDRINDSALRLCNNRSNLEVGDVLFSGTGTIGETALIVEPPLNWNIKEGVYAIKPTQDKIIPRFLMYLLQTSHIKAAISKKVAGGTVKSIPMSEMQKIKIPVPELRAQKRIVELLDRFDALCNDLTSGLPAEIEARQKQYEYYRDKILTFPERKNQR